MRSERSQRRAGRCNSRMTNAWWALPETSWDMQPKKDRQAAVSWGQGESERKSRVDRPHHLASVHPAFAGGRKCWRSRLNHRIV